MALTDGIIGCWSPSIRGSGYLLPDLSGRGNHGVLTNMDAGTDWPGASVRGVGGVVLDFDGGNDYVATTKNLNPYLVGTITISLWAACRAYSTVQAFVSNLPGGNNGFALEFGRTANKLTWLQNGSTVDATSTGTITDTEFHHVVLTRSGSTGGWTITFAIDGVTSTHTTTANPVAASISGNVAIGRFGDFSNGYLNARVGEVTIYQRALTQPEVMELYRSGNGAIGRQLTGQTRRRVYGFVAATGARRRRILCGDYS